MSDHLDPRIHAVRQDLADEALRDRVRAPRYASGHQRQVTAGSLPLRTAPAADARLGSELLFGETGRVFETRDGWAWLQNDSDSYVGYAPVAGLSRTVHAATHTVAVLRTYLFPEPDLKAPPLDLLSMNSRLAVSGSDRGFSRIAGGGWVWTAHLSAIDAPGRDPAAVALQFLGAPYLWGGRTSLGLDCSGLIQMALGRCGITAPRDSDMQQTSLGHAVDFGDDSSVLRRNDLVFWPGHVGIVLDSGGFLHANATDMMVALGRFDAVREHIRNATGHDVSAVRRF